MDLAWMMLKIALQLLVVNLLVLMLAWIANCQPQLHRAQSDFSAGKRWAFETCYWCSFCFLFFYLLPIFVFILPGDWVFWEASSRFRHYMLILFGPIVRERSAFRGSVSKSPTGFGCKISSSGLFLYLSWISLFLPAIVIISRERATIIPFGNLFISFVPTPCLNKWWLEAESRSQYLTIMQRAACCVFQSSCRYDSRPPAFIVYTPSSTHISIQISVSKLMPFPFYMFGIEPAPFCLPKKKNPHKLRWLSLLLLFCEVWLICSQGWAIEEA